MIEYSDTKYVGQIGKGSFSIVYLYENLYCYKSVDDSNGSSLLFSQDVDKLKDIQYFIIKKIDLSILVSKFAKRPATRNATHKRSNIVFNTTDNTMTPDPYSQGRKNATTEDIHLRLRELIESEIKILKYLDSPYIIRYYDSSMTNDVYYIQLEF